MVLGRLCSLLVLLFALSSPFFFMLFSFLSFIESSCQTPPTYAGIRGAARAIYTEAGLRGFWRGFAPCILRAFPANAACFVAFEIAMRLLPF